MGEADIEEWTPLKPGLSSSSPVSQNRDSSQDVATSVILGLALYWWGVAFFWFIMLIVMLPSQLLALAGNERKGVALGAICLFAAFFSVMLAPIIGWVSDHCTHRWGRRRPFMVAGSVGVVLMLAGMQVSTQMVFFGAFYIALQAFSNMASCPFNALIPDLVPLQQRGTASGYLGSAYATGTLSGTVIGYYYDDLGAGWTSALLALVVIVTVSITFSQVEEVALHESAAEVFDMGKLVREFFSVFENKDFKWVFLTRLLVQQGIFTVQEFLQFYLKDAIPLPVVVTPESTVSVVMAPLVTMSIISAFIAGHLTDYVGQRKVILYFCGGLMITADVLLAFARSYQGTMFCAFVFGIGYGGFCAVDFCLVMDVLPEAEDAGKDLGIWHIALVLPQATAAPIGGILLDFFQEMGPEFGMDNLGYTVLFFTSAMYFSMGIYFLHKVEKVK